MSTSRKAIKPTYRTQEHFSLVLKDPVYVRKDLEVSTYLGHGLWRKCDCIQHGDEVPPMQAVKVPCADIVGMQPLWGGLGDLLHQVRVPHPEQFRQPDSVEGAWGQRPSILLRDAGSKFGNS